MKEQFRKFLVSKKLFAPFVRNMRWAHDMNFDRYMALIMFPANYLSDAFEWKKTKQGQDFWKAVDKDWDVVVEEERKKHGKQSV